MHAPCPTQLARDVEALRREQTRLAQSLERLDTTKVPGLRTEMQRELQALEERMIEVSVKVVKELRGSIAASAASSRSPSADEA
jgi:hypothetical protein